MEGEEEDNEMAEDEPQEDEPEEDDGENTNNNADENEDAKIDETRKKRVAKRKEAPKSPTCGILVVLYGDRGKTSVLPLLSSAPGGVSSFQPGCADEFKVPVKIYS